MFRVTAGYIERGRPMLQVSVSMSCVAVLPHPECRLPAESPPHSWLLGTRWYGHGLAENSLVQQQGGSGTDDQAATGPGPQYIVRGHVDGMGGKAFRVHSIEVFVSNRDPMNDSHGNTCGGPVHSPPPLMAEAG